MPKPTTQPINEPWCNHDAIAVVNGVCECGETVDPLPALVAHIRELATQVIDSSELVHPAHRDTPARLLADAVADLDQHCTEVNRQGLLIDWPTGD